jgi:hypothetical protein
MRGTRLILAVIGVLVALAFVIAWPQGLHFTSSAYPHQDVYFNMWRLEWFAHALATHPYHLLDGNIFYPETRTLTLSDAMIVEGAAAAPFIWMRIEPVLVHNLIMFGGMVLSGAAMFALVHYLTGSRGAGLLAAIVFAFAPYRFEHIMHMEMQWTMWMPLAFLALHRALETGKLRYGLGVGAFVALQMLSCIYYGVFLATIVGACGLLLLLADRRVPFRRLARPLLVGALLAAVVCGAYAVPYLRTRSSVGERPLDQVKMFSARPGNYVVATHMHRVYGDMFETRGRPERRLFPGVVVVVLAIVGVLLRVPTTRVIVYVVGLVTAFELSIGSNGYLFPFLYEHVAAYRALRAPARAGIFTVMFLAALAGYGYVALMQGRSAITRRIAVALIGAALVVEYSVVVELIPYPNSAPAVYRYLTQQPRGVVAEFPVPRPNVLPGPDAEYSFMSIFHWFPLVNGYSGMYPPSYLKRLERLQDFPDERSLAQLRHDGVRYVILHGSRYEPDVSVSLRNEVEKSPLFRQLGAFADGSGVAYLYTFR